jgi:hypothetical protein
MTRTPAQVAGAGVAGALIGAAGGASLGSSLDAELAGAVGGAILIGVGEAVTDATRAPGTAKPAGMRIASGAAVAASLGWLVGLVAPDLNLAVYGVLFGILFGAIGFRLAKLALGAAAGLIVGLILEAVWPEAGLPWVAALTLIAYRIPAALIYRGKEQVAIMGERVPASEMAYVVPFAAHSRYVGVDYLKEYADLTGADFIRNPEDVGIVADFDDLAGPHFDPGAAHPLIREFYEHTSRFRLSITPEWRIWMKPAYLVYRSAIARPLGQANAPLNVEEVQQGVVSWIDTIDIDHSGEIDFRAWVRAYEESNEPLYIGIYTVLRRDDTGYVSVGFPFPEGNFTATLLPYANRGDGLLLKSRTNEAYPGHYLSAVEGTGDLTTLKLTNFDEEIDVYVENGNLRTDHRFSLGGVRFLTLYYTIERKR